MSVLHSFGNYSFDCDAERHRVVVTDPGGNVMLEFAASAVSPARSTRPSPRRS